MDLSHLLAFNAALIAALVSPGPALLVSVKTTLTAGRASGISLGLGLAAMASCWTLSALLGLEVIFTLFPWAFGLVKTLGALYLIYIAIEMWRGAKTPLHTDTKPAAHAFRQGLLINALNPKSVLFAAAVLVVIFPSGMGLWENALVVANHFAMEAIFYSGVAIAMSRPAVSQRYLRAKVYLDRISAGILGLLGLRLAFSR